MLGFVDTRINRFFPTTKTTPYIAEEASTIKN